MSTIIETKKNLVAFLNNVTNKYTLDEWLSFFKESELYFRPENAEDIYANYKKDGKSSIVSRCHLKLTNFCTDDLNYKLPKEFTDDTDFMEMFQDMRKKIGGLTIMLLNNKDDEVIERLEYLKDKSKSLREYFVTLLVALITLSLGVNEKENSGHPLSNAKQIDINTIFLPPELVVTNIN